MQGAGALTKGEDRIEVETFPITIDAITAINKTPPENIWTDAPQKELHENFAIKLAISNVPVGEAWKPAGTGSRRNDTGECHLENSVDEETSQHASSIGWVNKNPVVHSWDSSSSDGDYMVMAIKHKRVTELKVAGAQLPIKVNGKPTRVWIDSGSPISIFTIGELRKTLGTLEVKLDNLTEEDNAFQD